MDTQILENKNHKPMTKKIIKLQGKRVKGKE